MVEWTPVITFLCCVGGFALSYLANRRTAKRDAEEGGKSSGIVLTELGYIKASVDDVKSEQRRTNDQYVDVVTKIAMHDRDIKTAFSRIDDNKEFIDEIKRDIRAYHQPKTGG